MFGSWILGEQYLAFNLNLTNPPGHLSQLRIKACKVLP
jgi:hypothetical protein